MYIKRRQSGVTLMELVLFIVVVSIGVAGILGVMNMTLSQSADPLRRKQALMIAESIMEEVQMADFTFCDPTSPNADTAANTAACTIPENWGQAGAEPAGGRPFDNVNDYVDAAGNANTTLFNFGTDIVDATGALYGVNGYTASVSVSPSVLGGIGAGGTSADTAVLRITVAVTYGNNQSVVLDGYRTRYAPN